MIGSSNLLGLLAAFLGAIGGAGLAVSMGVTSFAAALAAAGRLAADASECETENREERKDQFHGGDFVKKVKEYSVRLDRSEGIMLCLAV